MLWLNKLVIKVSIITINKFKICHIYRTHNTNGQFKHDRTRKRINKDEIYSF